MDWRRPGDKPLSEPMMVSLLTHICVTRPQWVNMICQCCWWPSAARHQGTNSHHIDLVWPKWHNPLMESTDSSWGYNILSHWGQVMHICVSDLNIIDSDNGLVPGRRQAIIWTSAVILLICTPINEILFEIRRFSVKKMHLKRHLRNCGHFVLASMC